MIVSSPATTMQERCLDIEEAFVLDAPIGDLAARSWLCPGSALLRMAVECGDAPASAREGPMHPAARDCCNLRSPGAAFCGMSAPSDGAPSGPRPTLRRQVYRPRVVDQGLHDRLRSRGAVVIEGAKACGKTATAMHRVASVVRLDVDAGARRAAEIDAALVLNGPTPRLLDEWQTVPTLWNHVRRAVDDRALPGQFILTGSATPADDITRHTGAGRLSRLRMRTMSCFETGHATGMVSLRALFDGEPARSPETALTVPNIAMRVAVGGWPGHLTLPDRDAGGPEGPLDRDTAARYLDALDRLMITEAQPAWTPHLRSRSRARTAPKRHFVDPSLAAAALGATPPRLLRDVETLGLLFEALVVRDLRVYAQSFEATVLHYRDNTGLEVDAIVETSDGAWAALEIKLGHARLDEAAANLLRFADRVDDRRTGQRARLVVITGTGYAYDRPDGVAVVPIGALGP